MKQKRNLPLLLFLIYLVFIVPIFIWLFLDKGLPHWDMGRHLSTILQYRDLWKQLLLGQRNIFGLLGFYTYYPPLIYQLALVFFKVFGVYAKVAVLTNLVWIFILFWSVYQLSLRIYKNQLIALSSVIFLGAAPLLIGQAREFQVDLPLTAMVALSLWIIFKTEMFSNVKHSFIFGAVVGLSMLTKWTYAFYFIPMILIYLTYSMTVSKNRALVIINTFSAAAMATIICGYWYFTNKGSLLTDFGQNGVAVAKLEGDPTGLSVAALSWYFKRIIDNYLFLPLFIVYFASLVWALIKKEWRHKLALILILTPIYYLIFSILPNKDTRYLMPIIPLLAITGVCAFNISKNIYYRIALLVLLIVIFFTNNLNIAFSKNLNWQNNNIYLFQHQNLPLISNNGYTSNSPRVENCPIEPVMQSIPENSTVRLIGPNLIDYNNWMIAFYAGKNQKVWAGEQENFLVSEYLIFRNQDTNQKNLTAELKDSGKIKLINTYNCADGGRIELYKTISN